MGCGKSTTGKQLAKHLHFDFIDLDVLFVKKLKKSIPEYFAEFGEESFRNSERTLLREIDTIKNTIIATGGGTPCFADNMEYMKKSGITVYLQLSPALLSKRLSSSHTIRPMIAEKKSDDLKVWVDELLKIRSPFYKKAHIIMDARNLSLPLLIKVLAPYLTQADPLGI